MTTPPSQHARQIDCDLLVIGSGASGLAAAVTAAWHGLRVVVVEKHDSFGGATAWSGGWAWVPGNPLAKRAGIHEDPQQPRTYLKNELGERYNAERVDAFLDNAPHMVAFFEQHTALQWVDGNGIPDVHGKVEGAATQGHQVIAAPFNGREMGKLVKRMRKTMRETSFLGMPIMAGAELFPYAATSFAVSLLSVVRLVQLEPDARAIVNQVFTWITSGDFRADFTLRLMHKDQELVLATAGRLGYEFPPGPTLG